MIIRQEFMPKDHPSRPGLPLNNPTSITIHWIGPYVQTPDQVRNWWLKGSDGKGIEASAHFIIRDDDVLQCIPEQEVAWHCGSKGNYSSIGIEIVPIDIRGEFSLATIDSIIALCKRLPKVILKRHYDWTSKDCPRYYTPVVEGGNDRWFKLVKTIEEGRIEV